MSKRAALRASVIWLTLWLGRAAYDARAFWARRQSRLKVN